MIALLLKKSKKKMKSPKTKTSFHKRKGKKNDVKTLSPNTLMAMRITLDMKILSPEEPENSEDNHAKKMNELEKRLEAISN